MGYSTPMNSIVIMALMVFVTFVLAMADSPWWAVLMPLFAGRWWALTFR